MAAASAGAAAPQLLGLALALRLALLPLGLYRSTDFEVHRNWLAITHSLPLSRWYYEETSPWTLDYPPLFAYFEWALSQVAAGADADMLRVSNLEYASPATVAFQRASVVLGDLVLLAGAWRLGAVRGAPATAAGLALANPGLLLVDHVHFQYNGMLLGLLMLSAADLEAGRIYRGAALFCVLLNMKQIFLYVAPVYFVYLLRGHCGCVLGSGPFGIKLRVPELLGLAAVVLGVFAAAWAPIACTGQLAQAARRLFPFGRGLTHAYWAPNAWALYNTLDRALAKLGLGNAQGPSSTAGFAEVYESSALWTVPPEATFVLTGLAYVPLGVLIWRQTPPGGAAASGEFVARPRQRGAFAVYAALGCAVAFALGWHVHEKAILMVTVPLLVAAAGSESAELREAAAALSAVGTFSLLPLLPRRAPETGLKWGLAIAGHTLELALLRGGGQRAPAGAGQGKGLGGAVAMLGIWPLPGWGVLLGILALGAYSDLGGHRLLFGGRMEFLPLLLVSDFGALLVLASFARLYGLAARAAGRAGAADAADLSGSAGAAKSAAVNGG